VDLTFEEASHQYRIDGRIVPSVTTVLKSAGHYQFDGVPLSRLEKKRVLGKAVHAYIAGEVVDPWINGMDPYVNAWEEFRRLTCFEAEYAELVMACKDHRFAGTLDLVGKLSSRRILLDVKTTAVLDIRATALQTAAYEYLFLLTHEGISISERFALHLKADGKYKLVPLRGQFDFAHFLRLLHQYHRSP
jgi:hypothetical protein